MDMASPCRVTLFQRKLMGVVKKWRLRRRNPSTALPSSAISISARSPPPRCGGDWRGDGSGPLRERRLAAFPLFSLAMSAAFRWRSCWKTVFSSRSSRPFSMGCSVLRRPDDRSRDDAAVFRRSVLADCRYMAAAQLSAKACSAVANEIVRAASARPTGSLQDLYRRVGKCAFMLAQLPDIACRVLSPPTPNRG